MSEDENTVERYRNSLCGGGQYGARNGPTLFILSRGLMGRRPPAMTTRHPTYGSQIPTMFRMLTGQFQGGRPRDSVCDIENCPNCSLFLRDSSFDNEEYDGYDSLEEDFGGVDNTFDRSFIQHHATVSEKDQPIAQSFEKRFDKSPDCVKAFWANNSLSSSKTNTEQNFVEKLESRQNDSDCKNDEVYHNTFQDPDRTKHVKCKNSDLKILHKKDGTDIPTGCKTEIPMDDDLSSENKTIRGSKTQSKKKSATPILNAILPQFGSQDSLKLFSGTETSEEQYLSNINSEWTMRDIMDEKLQVMDEDGEVYGMMSVLMSRGSTAQLRGPIRNSTAKGNRSEVVDLPSLLDALKGFAAANKLELKDGAPDGSCMFQAVADQLKVRALECNQSAKLLRQQAVDYLRNNPLHDDGTHLEQFLSTETWSAYLSRMSQATQWGDHMVLRAMSNMLSRNIIVCNVKPDGEVQQHELVPMKGQSKDNVALYLGHLGEFHYISLRPKNWEDNWFTIAKEKRQNPDFGIPGKSLNNDSEETLFQLCSDMTYVDPVSGVPLPHLSYLIVHQLSPALHTHIRLSSPLRLTDSNGSALRTEIIGSFGDGTRRILKDVSFDENLKEFHDIKWFSPVKLISKDKSYPVHCSNGRNTNNSFIADDSCTHPGYCRLRLADQDNQLPAKYKVVQDKGERYLERPDLDISPSDQSIMFQVQPSFECNTWPLQATEWISRHRPAKWPPASLVQKIHSQSCFVIQNPHPTSVYPSIEWQFLFSRAEKILLDEALSLNQRQCFDTYQIVVEYHLRNLKQRLSSVHLKSVFFYACEQIEENYWMDSFGGCFLFLTASLLRCVKERKLPNYFIRDNNMIDHIDNDSLLEIQNVLESLRFFPIESVTFMVERHGYNFGWISKLIKDDIPTYVNDGLKDLNRVVRKVFVPTTLKRAMKLANSQQYEYALEAVNIAYEELLMTPPSHDGKPTRMPRDPFHFLSEVIHNINDESTAYMFGTYLNEITGKEIYRKATDKNILRIRDLTDGEDTGGMGDVPVPKSSKVTPLTQAVYLDKLAYRFFCMGKFKVAGDFLGHAINIIDKSLASDTLDVDEISNAELRHDIATQKYQNKYSLTSFLRDILLHLCCMPLPEFLFAKLTQVEEICERFPNPVVVKYLADIWYRQGYIERAEEIGRKFGVLGYDDEEDSYTGHSYFDPYNQTQYI